MMHAVPPDYKAAATHTGISLSSHWLIQLIIPHLAFGAWLTDLRLQLSAAGEVSDVVVMWCSLFCSGEGSAATAGTPGQRG